MSFSDRVLKHIFIGLSSFQAIAMFRRGLFYGFLSIYFRNFLGLSVTETTLFATIPMILNVVFQTFVWGPLSDRLQMRRFLIIWGEVLAAIGTVLVWYIHSRMPDKPSAGWAIIIGLSVIEIFWSMSNTGWTAYISDVYILEKRSAVQGNLQSIGGFGHILGVLFGGFLYDGFNRFYNGWGFEKGALFFVSAAAMLASVIPIFLIPEGGTGAGGQDRPSAKQPGGVPTSGGFSKGGLFIFILFLAAMAFVNFGRNSIAMINSQYLTLNSGFHLTSQALSHLINAYSAAMIVSGFILGRLIIREKHTLLLMIGTAIAVLSSVLYFLAPAIGWIYCANILGGSSEVIIFAGSYAIASRLIPPQSRARLFGYFNATFFLSWGVAGTVISGPLIDYLIGAGKSQIFAYKSSYLVAAAITLIGLLLLAALTYNVMPRAAKRSAAADNMTKDGKEMEG